MRQFILGFSAALALVALVAFVQAGGVSSTGDDMERFTVYPETAEYRATLLLDRRTGRTWYQQVGQACQAGNGLCWSPIRITPSDTITNYYWPLLSDQSRQ